MDLSVIIPIYNEELNISLLHSRLKKVIDSLNVSWEFIFINDGSKDNSLILIKELAKNDQRIKYISFSRNFGHQVAVTAGLDACVGDSVVIIDADLQDPPELITDLYNKFREGYDVVYARRKARKGESIMKKITAKIFYRILKSITSVNIPVDTGDFRIISRKIVDILKQMPEKHKYLRGQISWAGYNQTFIEYNRDERNAGKTGYTYKKMMSFAMDGVTSFSNFPLKIVTYAGFLVSLVAFIMIVYALYSRFITKDYVQGWTSLMISVLFIGGIQLISIGIIGQYLSRINDNVRNRPLYIIGETNINNEKKSGE
ncbi:MAG: glycosyltransferase [Bacteroidetes bacterium GWF2_38_335]|nr:MAG: glycosyltransferase [Bacteroidetes bacterium GWF2_38_335]HBS88214.1 glycosyltransferase [Bacteroidales bacterium]